MNKNKSICFSSLIRHILAAWLVAVTAGFLLLPAGLRSSEDLSGLAEMSFFQTVVLTLCALALLLMASSRWKIEKAERCLIAVLFGVLAVLSLYSTFVLPFLIACILIAAGMTVYVFKGWNSSPEPAVQKAVPVKKRYVIITVIIAAAFFTFVSIWTVCRVISFSSPGFDFGIFAQMFYYMKETGLPMTTCERDGLLSHFCVHVSPVYYLLLPFYMLVPSPETLQVLQAAVMVSAVIPMWKIGRNHGLTGNQTALLCAVLLLFPAFAGGAAYDIHENCFLTPFILWIFYGIDRENMWVTAIFSVLTLTVKEDAAVYVAVIALWLIVRALLRKNNNMLAAGSVMFGVALIWFFAATGFLANFGDGVMTSRYKNFDYDGSGSLTAVVKAVLMNPLKVIYECSEKEKLGFIAVTMGSLLGLPLFTRRYERYILLIPYLLLNLMSDYTYQHNIFFQYTFGSLAFLMYLTAVNLADIRKKKLKTGLLTASLLCCTFFFCLTVVPSATDYIKLCKENYEQYDEIRSVLSEIPEDAPVAASAYYVIPMSQREVLYHTKFCSEENLLACRYVVMSADDEKLEEVSGILYENGYEIFDEIPDTLVIYTDSISNTE